MEKIIGLIDAPFTPFHENGDINLEPIAAYGAMLKKNGLKGVFINGSSGEGYMLTTDERKALATEWVKQAPADFSTPCSRDRGMGNRRHGTSFSTHKSYRRARKILRTNCSSGTKPPLLLLSYPRF